MSQQTIFIGTYTQALPHVAGGSEGIYVYMVDIESGELTHKYTVSGVENPSFLAIAPAKDYLYSVSEVAETKTDAGMTPGGAVHAYALKAETGELTYLNGQPSHGTLPCHLNVDATGQYVIAANYGSGSAAIYPVQSDGSLGEASQVHQHEGTSVNAARQEGPHAHSATLSQDNRFVFIADLGIDKMMSYQLDTANGTLPANDPPWLSIDAGQGPRHFDFHPNGRYAYVINELGATVTACAYDAEQGSLTALQTISTLPDDYGGGPSCADIHVHPSGKFVYGSNRGHDSIAIFAVDEATGMLTAIGHESTQGRTPRNFALDPSGSLLLAANQDTNTIVTFFVDQENGTLTATGHTADVPAPVCIKFL